MLTVQSNPSIPPILALAKSGGIPKTAVLLYWESYITYKTLIWDLEMGGGIGRGGIGRGGIGRGGIEGDY